MKSKIIVSLITVFSFFLVNPISAFSEFNLATNREELIFISTEKEIRIGESVSQQLEKKYEVSLEIDLNKRIESILKRIEAVCDRKELVYIIRVVEDDNINAVSLPGGYIYIFKGLVDKLESDDQLAGVIAHEMGHITARHAMKRLQGSYGYTLLQLLAIGTQEVEVAQGLNAAYATLFYAFSRKDEFEADKLAVKYTVEAGYDPKAMIDVLKLLQEEERKTRRPVSYFRTHPYINERIAALNAEINGKLQFVDYLNLMGNEENNF